VDREGKHVGDPRVNLRERKRERERERERRDKRAETTDDRTNYVIARARVDPAIKSYAWRRSTLRANSFRSTFFVSKEKSFSRVISREAFRQLKRCRTSGVLGELLSSLVSSRDKGWGGMHRACCAEDG